MVSASPLPRFCGRVGAAEASSYVGAVLLARRPLLLLALLGLAMPGWGQNVGTVRLPERPKGPPYGYSCGIIGDDPEPRTRVETFIEQRDTTAIFRWIREEDAVLRAYAAEAVIRLQEQGMPIPEAELERVEVLKGSKERVWVCSGCSYRYEEMQVALARSISRNRVRDR